MASASLFAAFEEALRAERARTCELQNSAQAAERNAHKATRAMQWTKEEIDSRNKIFRKALEEYLPSEGHLMDQLIQKIRSQNGEHQQHLFR